AWPGLEVSLSPSGRVAGVIVHTAGHALPHGLDIGTPRARVEAVLGVAPEMTDERYFYPDADGFPNSVEFFFRDGRVRRIEWLFEIVENQIGRLAAREHFGLDPPMAQLVRVQPRHLEALTAKAAAQHDGRFVTAECGDRRHAGPSMHSPCRAPNVPTITHALG